MLKDKVGAVADLLGLTEQPENTISWQICNERHLSSAHGSFDEVIFGERCCFFIVKMMIERVLHQVVLLYFTC